MPFKFPPAGAVFQWFQLGSCGARNGQATYAESNIHRLRCVNTERQRVCVCLCAAASIYDFKVNNFPMKYGAYYPTVAASKDHSFGLF